MPSNTAALRIEKATDHSLTERLRAFDAEAAALFEARYREPLTTLPTHWNDTLDTLLSHRSVRAYLPDALPAGTLETLIAAAQSAASSSNLQPWSVVAVEDVQRRDRLATLAANQEHIRQAPLFLVWLADLSRLDHIARRLDQLAEWLDYLDAFVVGVVDAALAAQNAVVALESLGLGSVYIGALRANVDAVSCELTLPAQVVPLFGLCVGYPDPAVPTAIKPRLPQSVILHRETYSAEVLDSAIARYDQVMTQFYAEQKMDVPEWTRHSTNRIRNVPLQQSGGALSSSVRERGFGLK